MSIPLWRVKCLTGEVIRQRLWIICERIPELRFAFKLRVGIQ